MDFEVLTKDEAASRARITRRFLDKRIKAGEGPDVLHIGRRALVRSDALQTWLERLTVQQHGKAA
jgi:excisionase family DNA binding protein